jgi:Uma2 family endonuclease
MSQHALRRMTADEFLEWDLDQPDARHELIDGVPVAMTGASRRHDGIVVNAVSELRARLRGGPCRPFTADVAIDVPAGNVRRPDMGVDCGPVRGEATVAAAPRLVVEVLSPSNRPFDQARKLEEYKSVESLAYILLVDTGAVEAILWSRGPDRSWQHMLLAGADAVIDLPAFGVCVPLGDVYEDVPIGTALHFDRDPS